MATRSPFGSRARLALLLAGAASGCVLIDPLGDFQEPPSAATGGDAGNAEGGSTSQGGSGATGGSQTDGGAGSGGEATGGSGAAGGEGACASNRDCVDIVGADPVEEPYRCRPSDHTCVPLKSPECLLAYGDATDDDAVFLGAFADYFEMDPSRSINQYPLQLAIEDFNNPMDERLPGLNGRQLVVTICDNDQARVGAAMTHLADEVEVPGVVANLKPSDLIDAFNAHPDVLYLSPVGRTSAVTALGSPMIWNLLGQPSDYADPYAALLLLLDTYVRNHTTRTPSADLRVALVVDTTDASTAELGDALEGALRFNDNKTTTENAENDAFLRVGMTSSSTTAVTNVVNELMEWVPDIVVSAAGSAFTRSDGIAITLDKTWAAGERPFYVLSPFNVTDLEPTRARINTMIHMTTGFERDGNRRFLGVSIAPPEDTTLQNIFAGALAARFSDARDRSVPDTGQYYDAMYFLAYAAYAADLSEPLTGTRMSAGLQRLIEGTSRNIGPRYIQDFFDDLDQGDSVALEGTLGPPNFTDGYRKVNASVFCYKNEGGTALLRNDTLIFDETSFVLNTDLYGNVFPCFGDFF